VLTGTRDSLGLYEVGALAPERVREFAWLTDQDLRPLLTGTPDPTRLAVGAALLGRPAGLAVASTKGRAGEILDLYVAPPSRGIGLGRVLLARTEELVRASGCATLSADVPLNEHAPAVERLLETADWCRIRAWRRFTGDFPGTTNPWWLDERHQVPPEFALSPWVELGNTERAELRARGAAGWYPAGVSPFEDLIAPSLIDPASSLVLRRGGEIVGFVVCQRWSPEVTYVATVFVGPGELGGGLRRSGLGTALIGQAVTRMIEAGSTHVVLDVDTWNRSMLRWARRFVLDSSPPSTVCEWHKWRKQLVPDAEEPAAGSASEG
jgi:ribosomal protein S18 acetylase RimI-like enzyme